MIARRVFPRPLQGEQYFRWRGGDVSRLESLSDMVFAFALTLIVVSLEVPRTFAELRAAFVQLPVFAGCFAILIMCWHYNYKFHRRYGFEDFVTEVLNAVLLFLILLYVYPLKFLFGLIYDMLRGLPGVLRAPDGAALLSPDGSPIRVIQGSEIPTLMVIYSAGYAGIFLLFALMYLRADVRREQLGLDRVEVQMTRATVGSHLIHVGFGLTSIGLVAIHRSLVPYAGLIYILIGPAQGLFWFWQGRKIDRLAA